MAIGRNNLTATPVADEQTPLTQNQNFKEPTSALGWIALYIYLTATVGAAIGGTSFAVLYGYKASFAASPELRKTYSDYATKSAYIALAGMVPLLLCLFCRNTNKNPKSPYRSGMTQFPAAATQDRQSPAVEDQIELSPFNIDLEKGGRVLNKR